MIVNIYLSHRSYLLTSFSQKECLVQYTWYDVPHLQFLTCRFGTLNPLVSYKVFDASPFVYLSGALNDGGGGPTEVLIIYPKKSHFRICLPKKIPMFLAYPKNSTPTVNCSLIHYC